MANAELWLELADDLRISVGEIPSNTERGLDEVPNRDVAAFAAVGKVGIGGIKISPDGSLLYAMNLSDKTVYEIDIATKTLNNSYAIPDPGCNNGTYRPWALGIREGVLYAGSICDGSGAATSSPNVSDKSSRQLLQANIYKLEEGNFVSVMEFPLDYRREPPFSYGSGGCITADGWYGWVDELPVPCDGNSVGYPQPILSDLDWDDQGDMILGFIDRSGLQVGTGNYGPTGQELYFVFNAGELLHACNDGSDNWTIENPSTCSNSNGGAIGGTNNTYHQFIFDGNPNYCLLYTSPSPRD